MRRLIWVVVILVVIGIGVAAYFLRPVRGPERDLTLTANAEHGAYLIRLGGCVSCHTDHKNGGAELAGGPGLVTPFGTFYPPNITSDPDAGIGNWTIAQFSDALSNGEGPQGHLYPAFPYDAYTLMSDQEIVDLFAALKVGPADATPSKPHEIMFPFSIRLAMSGWKNLFFHPERYEPNPAKSDEWNRGAYLANGPGHCVICHSPRNIFGAIETGKEFMGNQAGGPGGKTPNITAADLIRKDYNEAAIIEALTNGFAPDFDVLTGPMGEEIEDATKHWSAEDLHALAVYLLDEEKS
jgi:mono/diheme cytochrome c family protein